MVRHLIVSAVALTLVLQEAPHAQSGVVIFDQFEYVVDREDPSAVALFTTQGWSYAKTEQVTNGAHGWLYTTTTVPGYSGQFPGLDSTRVLALEARPRAFDPIMIGDPPVPVWQTDFFLQLGGNSAEYDNYIPGDAWLQFWMYPAHTGGVTSTFDGRSKFFYACNGDYPCHSHKWMVMSTSATNNPENMTPLGDPSQGEFFWLLQKSAGVSQITNLTADPYSQSAIGSPYPTDWMRPNRWTLVKMHFDTTHTTGNSWEVWLRPQGGVWSKQSEWIGNVTPGFTWDVPAEHVGGHRVLRFPTTVGWDYWLYLDDFVIARAESDLLQYDDGGTGPTLPPSLATALHLLRR